MEIRAWTRGRAKGQKRSKIKSFFFLLLLLFESTRDCRYEVVVFTRGIRVKINDNGAKFEWKLGQYTRPGHFLLIASVLCASVAKRPAIWNSMHNSTVDIVWRIVCVFIYIYNACTGPQEDMEVYILGFIV